MKVSDVGFSMFGFWMTGLIGVAHAILGTGRASQELSASDYCPIDEPRTWKSIMQEDKAYYKQEP